MRSAVQGWTRLGFLFAFTGGGFLGLHFAWLDPYAIYGRFVSFCLTPLVKASRHADAFAAWADGAEGGFARVAEVVVPASGFALVAAGVVAFIAALAAWCVSCRLCERTCRAHCIHIDAKAIDHTKCVSCFDCSAVCPKGAITWKR